MKTTPERCFDCSSECIPTGIGTGYAVFPDGHRVCYTCADKRQREELRDTSKPFVGYVSTSGGEITSWTGGKLMTITDRRPCRLTRQSWAHGKDFSSIRAVDCHGHMWFGRGSPGVAIRLRAAKA